MDGCKDESVKQIIQRRCIFFVGGYDPKSPAAFFERMKRDLARFDALWGIETRMSPMAVSDTGEIGTVRIDARSRDNGWTTATDFSFFAVDNLVRTDFARPLPMRVGRYLLAFADFALTGTAYRFLRKAWRFGLYFLYPFVAFLIFGLLGLFVAWLTAPWLGWLSVLPGLVVYATAQAVLGKRWSVNHLMDLWSFSLSFIRGKRPDAEALMERFALALVDHAKRERADELILVGHSTGGMLILDIAARCLRIDPDFAGYCGQTTVLTLGSTALKAGLHPAGGKFRERVGLLSRDERIGWTEIQCMTDVINFFRTNPATEMNVRTRPTFAFVREIQMRHMLLEETYRRVRKNPFRVHYQYIFGNSKQYWYDFFQVCCSPTPVMLRAERGIFGPLPEVDNP